MKKLLLLCAMSAVTTVSLYGGAFRIISVSEAAAAANARDLVARFGPDLSEMDAEGYEDMFASSLLLGHHAADPVDLIVTKIKTANRIYSKHPGGYFSLPKDLQEAVVYLPIDNGSKVADINRKLDAMGY